MAEIAGIKADNKARSKRLLYFLGAVFTATELWTVPTVLTGWITGVFGVHTYAAIGMALYSFFFHNHVPGDKDGTIYGFWPTCLFGVLEGSITGALTYIVGSLFA